MSFATIFLFFAIALLALAIADAVRFIRKERKEVRARKELLLTAGSIAASVNFFAFVVVAILIGGDALSGKVEAGRYYLGQHGTYTEVSRGTFLYSGFHATLALVGILAVAGASIRRRPR